MKPLIITLNLIGFCCCIFLQANAQEITLSRLDKTSPGFKRNHQQVVTLENKLRELEKQFNVSFLYNSGYVNGKTVKESGKNLTLEHYLKKILEPNNLSFKKLREKFYVIYSNESGDRPQPASESEPKTSLQPLPVMQYSSAQSTNMLASLYAQGTSQKTIRSAASVSGIVTDVATGEPLPGASVIVKNSSIGTTTNNEGRYELSNVAGDATLVFSFIGYLSTELLVDNRSVIDIKLTADLKALSEVVVVGYGSVSKKDVTGAVSSVGGDEIRNMPVRTATDALQGKAAGIMVTQSSGSPGSAGVVRIRGIGSINNSNEPLYIVDGLPQSGIGWLNPSDIETMDIHKDASAAAIYGSRASNGLVIITTRKGTKSESMSVTFDSYYGLQSPWKRPHMLNAEEFINYKNRAAEAVGVTPPISAANKVEALNFVRANTGAQGTDWWNYITQKNAPVQSYNVTVSGGSKKVDFASSVGYMDQKGIVRGSDYRRISWRNNVNAQLNDRVKLGSNIAVVYESRRNIDENNPYSGTIFSAMTADPITPVYRDNLTAVPSFYPTIMQGYDASNPFSRYAGVLYSNKPNPVAQIERMRQSIWEGISLKGGANLEVKILEPLKFRSNFGMDIQRGLSKGFTPQYFLNGYDYSTYNTVSNYSTWSNYFVWENTLAYDQVWGQHRLNALAGTSAELTRGLEYGASKQGIVNNNEDMRLINSATINPAVSGYTYSNALNSYFGRVSYSYGGRYVITGNVRRDGTSRFDQDYRWGTFPSVSAAWNFTQENFLKDAGLKWLSDGKLRASYGLIGNQNIGNGAYLSTYGNNGRYLLGNNTTSYLGAGRSSIGNPMLQWETSTQTDIGLDLTFLHRKLSFTADYFNKAVDNMLLIVPLPTTLGYPNSPWSNAGKMVNKGWEFAVGYDGAAGGFQYGVKATLSTFTNKVTTLGGGEPIYATAHLGETITKTQEGMPVGYYYGYQTDGIFQTQDEVNSSPQKGLSSPGDIRFRNINGDQILNADDRTKIGNPWPDFIYGFTLNASYKGFDVSAFIQGSQGNDVMNILRYDTEAGTGWYNAPKGFLEKAWNGAGSTNEYYKISQNAGLNTNVSQYFVEDGSYMRMKNMQVGYSLPTPLLQKAKIKQIRFYVGAQNLFTITKYSGLDPEMGSADPKLTGIDQGYFPQARTWMFGINAKF
ncbi:SusC/RagA family TonB-linked outer membrane protein [Dyadobacter frigoris]|uniref:TonB-dependent receptor n=1 Tax=Dyadobacter frigoris TaxID=2576211 RepID=A0A4U6CSQ0_9BACT|nr:TonB-dependent receptor [Dyadobacter frigoris]TKT86551.1 TonB-dependent receptor [Dyadobacter frigoris]